MEEKQRHKTIIIIFKEEFQNIREKKTPVFAIVF